MRTNSKSPHAGVIARIWLTLFCVSVLLASFLASGRGPGDGDTEHASLVVGPRACAECHEAENQTWLETAHHTSFKTLARSTEARRMSKALGIRRLKTDERCVRCHFTEQLSQDNKLKVIDGISCESCHGAGSPWMDLHSDYEPHEDPAVEEAHRQARIASSVEAGMRGPSNLHELAVGCYECHMVSDTELLDVGHPTGIGFELLEATQGEVRHNFVRGKGENVSATPERQRLLYWMGRVLEVHAAALALEGMSAPHTHAEPFCKALLESFAVLRDLKLETPPPGWDKLQELAGRDSKAHLEAEYLAELVAASAMVARALSTDAELSLPEIPGEPR